MIDKIIDYKSICNNTLNIVTFFGITFQLIAY